MLLNLKKKVFWDYGFMLMGSKIDDEENLKKIDDINKLSQKYVSWIEGDINKSSKDIYLDNIAKYNPRDHLEDTVEDLVIDNLNTCLTSILNNLFF